MPAAAFYGSISGEDSARGTLYFRREFGYIGTDQLGTIRVGATDQPSSLYMTGNFENFDGGGLNGDIPGQVAGPAQFTWPFADVGGVYTTTKVVYLSPQFFGFDFGVSFEPTTGNVNSNNGCGTGTYVGANFTNEQGGRERDKPERARRVPPPVLLVRAAIVSRRRRPAIIAAAVTPLMV